MIRFVKSLTVVVNRLTASVNKLAPRRRLHWLTRMDVAVLAVCAGALLFQGVNVLTPFIGGYGWSTAWAMTLFGWQWYTLAGLWVTIMEQRTPERLACRLYDCLGEVFTAVGMATGGTVTGIAEPLVLSYWTSEHWAAMQLAAVGQWTTMFVTPIGQPCVIENEALLTVMASWQAEPAAAQATANLMCRPARVLWLESAEVVW